VMRGVLGSCATSAAGGCIVVLGRVDRVLRRALDDAHTAGTHGNGLLLRKVVLS